MIPHLRDLCFERNPYEVTPALVENFIKLHDADWREAQSHWELLIERILNTDAVQKYASGPVAIEQAVKAGQVLLERLTGNAKCPVCPSSRAAIPQLSTVTTEGARS